MVRAKFSLPTQIRYSRLAEKQNSREPKLPVNVCFFLGIGRAEFRSGRRLRALDLGSH
jgi:hypothetical protein